MSMSVASGRWPGAGLRVGAEPAPAGYSTRSSAGSGCSPRYSTQARFTQG